MLSYRKSDIPLYNKLNANRVFLLRSWFVPEKHFPKKLNKNEIIKYGCDIAFIGHFENDGRLSYLEEIEKLGWKLKIFGPGYEWNKPIKKSNILSHHAPVNLVWEEEYNNAINGAKVALCFLSKLSRYLL